MVPGLPVMDESRHLGYRFIPSVSGGRGEQRADHCSTERAVVATESAVTL